MSPAIKVSLNINRVYILYLLHYRELRLNNTGCGVTGGKALAKLLKECYEASARAGAPLALRVFVLGRSRQENDGATALAEVFKMMGSLEEVVIPQNGIYHEGIAALSDAFANNPNLREAIQQH